MIVWIVVSKEGLEVKVSKEGRRREVSRGLKSVRRVEWVVSRGLYSVMKVEGAGEVNSGLIQ